MQVHRNGRFDAISAMLNATADAGEPREGPAQRGLAATGFWATAASASTVTAKQSDGLDTSSCFNVAQHLLQAVISIYFWLLPGRPTTPPEVYACA